MIENTEIPAVTTAPGPQRAPSAAQARGIVQGIVNLVLMMWTIWDIRHRSDDEINGKRKLWMMAAFAPPIGPIVYFIFGRKRRTQATEIPLETIEQA